MSERAKKVLVGLTVFVVVFFVALYAGYNLGKDMAQRDNAADDRAAAAVD